MDKLEVLLTRGVAQILPSKKGLKDLMTQKKITLYQGFDPTAPSLHIGNFIGIRKLAQFQKAGAKVIFLVGDFTAMIGDPTDKKASRKKLTSQQILKNLKDYKNQAGKILDFTGPNKAEIRFNSEWLSRLTFEEILDLASLFTVQQMLERDMFQERLKNQKPIYMHEFIYPLMQGYDCVQMGVDLEIGGSDQLFNMLAGRTLMKTLKNKEKYVLSLKLLEDDKGVKMGKTEGNAINLNDSPEDIYGKIMAFPDSFLGLAVELLTDLPLTGKVNNPLKTKKNLAYDVVRQIHGEDSAHLAETEFEKIFQKRGVPEEMREVSLKEKSAPLLDLIFESGLVKSRSEAKRLIVERGVKLDGKVMTDPQEEILLNQEGKILKIGKRRFAKIKYGK